MTKKCNVCKEIKGIEDFYSNRKKWILGICKKCHNDRGTKRYRSGPKQQYQRARKWLLRNGGVNWSHNYYRKKRQELIMVLGGHCIKCGFSDWRALQVDHTNGGGAKERRTADYKKIKYPMTFLKHT
jgi:hypothetical protein